MAEVARRTPRGETELAQARRHVLLAVAGEAELRAQLPVIGKDGAYQARERREEEAVAGAEPQQREGVGNRRDVGRYDIAEEKHAVGLEQAMEQRRDPVELFAGEVL